MPEVAQGLLPGFHMVWCGWGTFGSLNMPDDIGSIQGYIKSEMID